MGTLSWGKATHVQNETNAHLLVEWLLAGDGVVAEAYDRALFKLFVNTQ